MKRNTILSIFLLIGIITLLTSMAGRAWNIHVQIPPSAAQGDDTTSIQVNSNPYFKADFQNPITFKDLRLIPIRANDQFMQDHLEMGPYMVLTKAMESGAVTVTEQVDASSNGNVADMASVNELFIENSGKDTVFVMAGEMVKGGKQDRIIAKSFLLFPNSGKVNLSVFCVEHGRWETDGVENIEAFTFSVKKSSAANSLREVALVQKEQTKVWDKVSEITVSNDCSSETGTYNALDSDIEFTQKNEEYEKQLGNIFQSNIDIVGVAVFSGNNFIGIDVFCSPKLFSEEWPTLLGAYVSDVITTPSQQDSTDKVLMQSKFNGFLQFYFNDNNNKADQMCMNKTKVVHCAMF